MTARHPQERKYGGMTLGEIRAMAETNRNAEGAQVLLDLVTEIEATGAQEVAQRLRRIETRIHKMAVHVGAEPNETTMTLFVEEQDDRLVIQVPGYDVTLAQIRRAVEQKSDATPGRTLYIVQGQSGLLATVRLTART